MFVVIILLQEFHYLAVVRLTIVMTAKTVERTVHYVCLEKCCRLCFVSLFASNDNCTSSCLGESLSHVFSKLMFALVRWLVLY